MEHNQILLLILEVMGIGSCVYGAYSAQNYSKDILSLTYNELWFAFGALSNLCGLISIAFTYIERPDEFDKAASFLQYHYLLAWFAVIVGYPTLVSSFWNVYYPGWFSHIHAGLALVPIVAWLTRQNRVIVLTTQIVSALAILSHAYICTLAFNDFGLAGAAIMAVNVVCLSLPTKYNFAGLSSRELFLVGLAGASYVLSVAVAQMAEHPNRVKNIAPWYY